MYPMPMQMTYMPMTAQMTAPMMSQMTMDDPSMAYSKSDSF